MSLQKLSELDDFVLPSDLVGLASQRSGSSLLGQGRLHPPRSVQALRAPPSGCPALVLNADFRPLSYYPLSIWPWQEAVKAVFQDRVDVVATYDRVVRSPTLEFQLPSVVSLRTYVDQDRSPAFTRFNLFLRDGFTCQYCGQHGTTQDLTFDHVIPRSKGGRTSWENIVTACAPCNLKKGGRTPKEAQMLLHKRPVRPNSYQLQELGRRFPPQQLHESWVDYLYWDVELEA